MRVLLEELLNKLGISHIMCGYETMPYSAYDTDNGLTASAEVRMGSDENELEAEVQTVRDDAAAGPMGGINQIMWLQAELQAQQKWEIKTLRIKGENWVNKIFNWDEKACNLFRGIAAELSSGNIPDFDELIDRYMNERERFGDQRGSGGGKSPKIKPAALLDMKKGQGF